MAKNVSGESVTCVYFRCDWECGTRGKKTKGSFNTTSMADMDRKLRAACGTERPENLEFHATTTKATVLLDDFVRLAEQGTAIEPDVIE